jgi:hypothetical protein
MKSLYPRRKQILFTKVCPICEKRKPSSAYYLLPTGYLHSYCKPCHSLYMKHRYKVVSKS